MSSQFTKKNEELAQAIPIRKYEDHRIDSGGLRVQEELFLRVLRVLRDKAVAVVVLCALCGLCV